MLTTDVTFPGTNGLSDIEAFADQEEEVLGPLVNLGNAGPNSVLTFDMSIPPPKQFVILRTTPGGTTPVVAGFTLVCQGNCLVGGQLTGVAALRSDAEKPSIPSVKPGSAVEQALTGELPAAVGFKDLIVQAATANNLPPVIVAAIGSVESGWGTSALMQPNGPAGTGDRTPRPPKPPLRPGSMPTDGLGFGRGLMQIDWDSHEFARSGNWRDAAANIAFSCDLFASNRDRFVADSGMNSDDAITAAIAAYNLGFAGASRLIESEGLKAAFASNSYAAKVVNRVEFFRANGFDAGAAFKVAAAPGAGPFVASSPENLLGTSVPDGQCVAYVRKASGAPNTATWRQGDLVKGNTAMRKGTAVATFDPNGRYGNHTDGRSHAAIYLGQDSAGLVVLDQWASPQVQLVHQRHIRFGGSTPVNDGNAFFVIV